MKLLHKFSEENGSCDEKMFLIEYEKDYIFYFYSRRRSTER